MSRPSDDPASPPAEHPPHRAGSELDPSEEPDTTGTLFIMILFLMALVGMWAIMYFTLLER